MVWPSPSFLLDFGPMRARLVLGCVAAAALAAGSSPRAESKGGDPVPVLDSIVSHVTDYYSRAQSLIGREEVIQQPIKSDLSFEGMPTRYAYQLRLEWAPPEPDAVPGATMMRELLTVNGRVPKPKDKPKCMQPREEWPEPLTMFLPEEREAFQFKWAGLGRMDGVETVSLDFQERPVTPRPEPTVTFREGASEDDQCASYAVPGRTQGRVWVNRRSGEVLRLDQNMFGPVDIKVPKELQRKWRTSFFTIDRHSTSTRYKRVRFQDPDESLMLPDSIQTVSISRGNAQPMRVTQRFTNYRRFLTGGRLVE